MTLPRQLSEDGVPRRSLLVIGGAMIISGCVGDDSQLDHGGDITLIIDGSEFDLSQDQFQAEHADEYAMEFHLHETSDQWYNEGTTQITLAEALDLLPEFEFETDETGDRLVIEDEVFDSASENVTISYEVNGEAVDPEAYELDDGDAILISIETE